MKNVSIFILLFFGFNYAEAQFEQIHANICNSKTKINKIKTVEKRTYIYKFGNVSENPTTVVTTNFDTLGNLTECGTVSEDTNATTDSTAIDYFYDAIGRVINSSKKKYWIRGGLDTCDRIRTSEEKDVQTYEYDSNGEISAVTINTKWYVLNFKFTQGRIVQVNEYSSDGNLERTGAFEYQNDRLTQVIRQNAHDGWAPKTIIKYNSKGLMTDSTELAVRIGGWRESKKVTYKYDKNNLLVERVYDAKPVYNKCVYLYNGYVLNEIDIYDHDGKIVEKSLLNEHGCIVESTEYAFEAGETLPKKYVVYKYTKY